MPRRDELLRQIDQAARRVAAANRAAEAARTQRDIAGRDVGLARAAAIAAQAELDDLQIQLIEDSPGA